MAMKKILVVDDSVINLKMAEKVLKLNEDYKPVLVPSGSRAMKFLSANVPDMILLGVLMPEMDGFAVLAAIQEKPELANVPVVFLTADEDPETAARAKAAGVKAFIKKPFAKQDLLDAVAKYLAEGDN